MKNPIEDIADRDTYYDNESVGNYSSATCSAFWWIMGTVIVGNCVCLARKHRVFRFIETWSWGRWNGIRDEYPEIPESFEQNATTQTPT